MIYIDRSRYLAFFECPLKRFLAYHLFGKGLATVIKSIPLTTGGHTHSGIEKILNWVIANDHQVPTEDLVRTYIEETVEEYIQEVSACGLVIDEDDEELERVIMEQSTLITALLWGWADHLLPTFLEEFQVIHVEQEMEHIIKCDCGLLGVGEVQTHVNRNCTGVVLMTRPDIITKKWAAMGEGVQYFEVKTGTPYGINNAIFENSIQFALSAAAIETFTGEEMLEAYVHGLIKGSRKKAWCTETKGWNGPKSQQTSLCYGFYKPGVDGLVPPEYAYRKGKGVTNAFEKTAVWDMRFPKKPEGISKAEFWVKSMPDDELVRHVSVLGAYPYPGPQVNETLEDLYYVETNNAKVYEYLNTEINEKGFGHEDSQQALREYCPRSWNCKNFNTMCGFWPICKKYNGWEEPMDMIRGDGSPRYEERTANHPIEDLEDE